MKKPANAGAHGLSKNVSLAADSFGYASQTSVLQARTLSHRYGLSAAVAAVRAEHCFGVSENWRGAR
jgi:hypothetical protein